MATFLTLSQRLLRFESRNQEVKSAVDFLKLKADTFSLIKLLNKKTAQSAHTDTDGHQLAKCSPLKYTSHPQGKSYKNMNNVGHFSWDVKTKREKRSSPLRIPGTPYLTAKLAQTLSPID